MASEALYAGLAAGGNELASIMREKRKAELEERLMKEREARADQREAAREARAEARRLKQPARRELDPARGVVIVYNAEDEVLKEIPATAAELKKASDESRLSDYRLGALEFEASTRQGALDREIEKHRAGLGLIGAQTAAYNRRGEEDKDDPASMSDIEIISSALDGIPSIKELTMGKYNKDGELVVEPVLSSREIEDLGVSALAMWKTTKGEKGQPHSNFQDFLASNIRQAAARKDMARNKPVVPTKAGATQFKQGR